MRDGVKLAARRAASRRGGALSDARLPHALRAQACGGQRGRRGRRSRAATRSCCVDVRGRYGSRGRVRPVRQRGPRRLRHDRVGRGAALVHRRDRDVRPVLSGRRAVAGGRRVAAAPEGDGSGDDVFHRRAISSTRAEPGTCPGSPGSGRTSRPTRGSARSCRARRRARRPTRPGRGWSRSCRTALPLTDLPELQGGGAVLLRLAGAPARRGLLGLDGPARPLRQGERRGPQLLGLARRDVRAGGRDHELSGPARGAQGGEGPAHAAADRSLDPRRRGHRPLGRAQVRADGAVSTTRS